MQTVEECKTILGVSEFHGKDLGIPGIGKIAPKIEELIVKYDCHFVLTLTDKVHHAAIRLAEILLDSDFNQAVSRSHDMLLPLRRSLTVPLVQNMRQRDKMEFWHAYETGDYEEFSRVLETLQLRIYENDTNPRMKEILLNAISWALKYPSVVLRPKPSKYDDPYSLDSPNIGAFIRLIDGLHQVLKPRTKVVRFIHDVQKQFGKAISDCFELLHKATVPRDSLLVQKVKTFRCQIELLLSQSSVGLQLIDVCLWLMVKTHRITQPPESEACLSLLRCITERAVYLEYSFAQLVEDCRKDYRTIMSKEITPEKLVKASNFRDDRETRRIRG